EFADRCARRTLGLELRRLADVLTNVIADRPDQQAEQERYAPAPAAQLLRRQQAEQDHAEQRGEHGGEPLAEPLEGGEEAFALARMFHQERGGAAELAGDGEALQ